MPLCNLWAEVSQSSSVFRCISTLGCCLSWVKGRTVPEGGNSELLGKHSNFFFPVTPTRGASRWCTQNHMFFSFQCPCKSPHWAKAVQDRALQCPVHSNQDLGESLPPFWPLCLTFLPVETAAICKWEGGGSCYRTRSCPDVLSQCSHEAVPEASDLPWIFQYGQEWDTNALHQFLS